MRSKYIYYKLYSIYYSYNIYIYIYIYIYILTYQYIKYNDKRIKLMLYKLQTIVYI